MKKLHLTLAIVLMISINGYSQFSFRCTQREDCTYNKEKKEIEDCTTTEESTLFVLDQKFSVITHFTKDRVSTYTIKTKKTSDDNKTITLEVTSDKGNDYTFVIFLVKKSISALYKDKDYNIRTITFTHEGLVSYQ
jgi:hypothetical protein